jgi:two-component system response regulator AtoC
MAQVRHIAQQVRSIRVPILICGESGTGKEVLARYLHDQSPWRAKPFLKVNCAAIPGTLLESELFGYEKGAFTGAFATHKGKFEQARDGTVCLDEISEISAGLQAKLLQVLQDGSFYSVGGCEEIAAQAQVMCLSNRDLEGEVERGAFRRDLFYRINVMTIALPPLRARQSDIPALLEFFLQRASAKFSRPAPVPSKHLLKRLYSYTWPGNIRELENYVKRFVLLGSEEVADEIFEEQAIATPLHNLQGEDLNHLHPSAFVPSLPSPQPISLKKFSQQASQKAERFLILRTLKATRWNRKQAAQLLQISYRALLYKIRNIRGDGDRSRPLNATFANQD